MSWVMLRSKSVKIAKQIQTILKNTKKYFSTTSSLRTAFHTEWHSRAASEYYGPTSSFTKRLSEWSNGEEIAKSWRNCINEESHNWWSNNFLPILKFPKSPLDIFHDIIWLLLLLEHHFFHFIAPSSPYPLIFYGRRLISKSPPLHLFQFLSVSFSHSPFPCIRLFTDVLNFIEFIWRHW